MNTYRQIQCRPTPTLWEYEVSGDNHAEEHGFAALGFTGLDYRLVVLAGQPGEDRGSAALGLTSVAYVSTVIDGAPGEEQASAALGLTSVAYVSTVVDGAPGEDRASQALGLTGLNYLTALAVGHPVEEAATQALGLTSVAYSAAAAQIQSATYNASAEATTHNFVFPSVPAAGNRIILCVYSIATVATPAGWTLDSFNVNSICVYIFSKIAGASEPTSVALTQAVSVMLCATGLEYAGLGAGVDQTANASTWSTAAQTTGTTAATSSASEVVIAAVAAAGDLGGLPGAKDNNLNSFVAFSNGFTTIAAAKSTGTTVTYGSICGGAGKRTTTSTGTQESTGTFAGATAYPSGAIVSYRIGPAPSSLLGGLIEFWPMQEAGGSRAGAANGLDLTSQNSVGSVVGPHSDLAAQVIKASSQMLYRAQSSALNNNGATGFEFCLWARADSLAFENFLISKDAVVAGPDRQYNFVVFTSGELYIEIHNTTGAAGVISQPLGIFVTAGAWHMLNFWFNTADQKGYASIDNGTAVATGALSGTLCTAGANQLEFGARSWSTATRFGNCSMNRVGFWNRILTPSERTALYNAGAGKSYPF